ncbi:Caveolin [Teladorsagia circumcincta]|uniref:Caveolin n=1 Tax=Teladorsagia circumcincta TaxID=45464 RepID=A0A2G9UZM3_TELCI|nr:Caveolin [Teladorsagia circumcincta]
MSRRSSSSSLQQKNVPKEESVAQDIEDVCETTQASSVVTHITASRSVEHSSAVASEKAPSIVVSQVTPQVTPVVAPDANELKFTPPIVEPRSTKSKTTLPMPVQPAKEKDPQMAFDFNGHACKEVTARQLNMDQRDEHGINQDLKTHFLDIFAEPDSQYHSVACVWTISYRVFEVTRIYCYKILTLIFGLPIALIAGFIFALFSFLRIWITQVGSNSFGNKIL